MGLHLSEGAIHAVQTPFAYLGYKTLGGFAKTPLKGIPADVLKEVGCFIDHELLYRLEEDNRLRKERLTAGRPMRILMTVGGAGAGFDDFAAMVEHLLPYVKEKKVALFINFGDHDDVYNKLIERIGDVDVKKYFNDYAGLLSFTEGIREGEAEGIYAICNEDIFSAVYSTNLLMPVSDLLITKPSELAYYPIPKVFMKHIGGHEVYGTIHGREYGDSTDEYPDKKSMAEALDRMIADKEIIFHMMERIEKLKAQGYYDGAYNCVRLAVGERV